MFLTDYKEMQNFIFKNRKKEDFQNMFEIKLLQLGFYVSVALIDSKGRIKDPTFMRNIGWTLDGEKGGSLLSVLQKSSSSTNQAY